MMPIPGLQEIFVLLLVFAILHLTGIRQFIVQHFFRDESGAGGAARPAASSPTESEVAYQLLGVSPSAKWDEIERAYRSKAKRHHPDHGGDEDAMRALNEAYRQIKALRGKR